MTLDRTPAELWTAEESAASDRYTMDVLGVPSPVLMERAALCASHEIVALRGRSEIPVMVMVGPGNNGGDGLAIARQLHGWGVAVEVFVVTPKRNAEAEAQVALCRTHGVPVAVGLPTTPPGRRIVVDALLGTGARGAPRGEIAHALAWSTRVAGPRVAVDVPSGVDATTGAVSPDAFEADLTITFARSKPGLHVTPGRHRAGLVVVAEIDVRAAPEIRASHGLIDPCWVHERVRRLPAGRHKNERGHVGVFGGSAKTPGAAILTGTGALRGGAGLVTLATRDAEIRALVVAHRPELMVDPLEDLATPAPRADVLVVGPGLTDPASHAGLGDLWRHDPRPALWDASALDHVPLGDPPAGPRILTPHPGEAARMLARLDATGGWTSGAVQADRLAAARRLADESRAIVVLKGEGTVIAEPAGRVAIAVAGGPALATAGSGDGLSGLGGAMLARGLPSFDAACVAVHVHGVAGELAAARFPGCGALDITEAFGEAMTSEVLQKPVIGWPRFRLG